MRLLCALFALLSVSAPSAAEYSFTPESGEPISYERLAGGKGARLLVFPADEGFVENGLHFASALAAQGFEVVYPYLHDSYFLNTGAYSLSAIPREDLVALVAHIDTPDRPLFVVANQRVALLALEVMDAYQRRHPGRPPGGLVLLSPYLEAGAPDPGEAIRYHPVTGRSNLPVYIFQPRSSSRVFHLKDTVAALSSGGSPVFVEVVEETRDAYHIWPEEITAHEAEERERLPARMAQAIALLQSVEPAALKGDAPVAVGQPRSKIHALPQPIAEMPPAPALGLVDLDGRAWRAGQMHGRVVLLNFWATWCPPCVEELPALQRLHERMQGSGFSVVSVDVAEQRQTIERFLQSHGIRLTYPILLDPEGGTVDEWKLTGFPTSFLVDRRGRIRYGLIGAIEWDNDEVVGLIQTLLAE